MPRSFDTPLPIDAVLDELARTLADRTAAVLVAPPGAGKTTRVPLALLGCALGERQEDHRAGAAADRGARQRRADGADAWRAGRRDRRLPGPVRLEGVARDPDRGRHRGHLLPPDSRRSRIDGVAAVLFDEFHERSLDADLGLALARDAQTGLREDLRILVMSATLDGARVARLLGDAPVIESQGRAFPVETRYLGREADAPMERQMATRSLRALRADPGSVLAFLPGAAEIRRTQNLLASASTMLRSRSCRCTARSMRAVQDRAISPAPQGRRKVVLATSIAETSLTIEGVRIVVDCGLARVPRYEPDVGLTRLETVRVSRAAADQRRGRAGRTEPGVCYRLWDEPQTASLTAYTPAGNPHRRLSSLALDLAAMGRRRRPTRFSRSAAARGARRRRERSCANSARIDADGRITEEGQHLRALPLPPRLARMIVDAHRARAGARRRRDRRCA